MERHIAKAAVQHLENKCDTAMKSGAMSLMVKYIEQARPCLNSMRVLG